MKLEDPAVTSVLGGTRSGPGSSVGLPKSTLSIPRVASLGAGSVFLGEAVILGGIWMRVLPRGDALRFPKPAAWRAGAVLAPRLTHCCAWPYVTGAEISAGGGGGR